MRLGPQQGVLLENEAEFEMSRYMQPYEVSWDMGLYLRLFERKCRQLSCERDTWSQKILTVLPCEVVDVVARLSEQHANNYEAVKAELIRRFGNSVSKKKERLAPESESEARHKALAVEARHEALETEIVPEKGPRILESIKVEHVENEALAGLEVGTMSKDSPCVDEEGASSPNGPSKKLETFFVPQEDVSTSSNVGNVSAVVKQSENATLQECSDAIGEGPVIGFISIDKDNLAQQSVVTQSSNSVSGREDLAQAPTSFPRPQFPTRHDDGIERKEARKHR
ncbi:uncharacterized protein LOC142784678 [Rhipicephalus microplus]|uniref:uncharacterized protein LOC142784678 n=1 Tax=Rhipicephalus microplus TaxID=6941 RepID=UPI003F6B8D74